MPIKHAIWTVGKRHAPIPLGRLATEQQLEEMIVAVPAILSPEWMLIGQQEITPFAGRIDLLAIAPDASLVLIEHKRDKTSLDLFWLKDDCLADQDGLPEPTDLAEEVIENIESGVENLRNVVAALAR